MLNQIQQDLLNAADVLRTYGWCREVQDAQGRICILRALAITTAGRPTDFDNARIAIEEIVDCTVIVFNDHRCHNQEEAISALEAAAKSLDVAK